MKTITASTIDKANIGLMILSLIAAFIFPFELFLFVYAFLGPLHYLTEINWLHKKQYFTNNRYDYIIIIFFIVLISALTLTKSVYRIYVPVLIFFIFGASFGMVFFKRLKPKIIFAITCGLGGLALYYFSYKGLRTLFSSLLPTIVHVFIFTGFFILLGALKSKSALGITSVAVFICCACATLFIRTDISSNAVSQYIYSNHHHFIRINNILIGFFDVLHSNDIRKDMQVPSYISQQEVPVYLSQTGISIMRFIAFAYTYHYLNWFSKTSVIQWHNTKKLNLFIIFAIWIASVALYIYNYKTGLTWLYLLSFGHVLLEFPLNHISILEIKRQLTLKFSGS